jgi:hypothetical protein
LGQCIRAFKEVEVLITDDLLEKGMSRPGRDEMAKVTGISEINPALG